MYRHSNNKQSTVKSHYSRRGCASDNISIGVKMRAKKPHKINISSSKF